MARQATQLQNNFSAGELSPVMDARSDIGKYFAGCRILQNFIVLPQGGAFRRPGSEYIDAAPRSDLAVRLIPFIFSDTDAYVLEFSHRTLRFYKTVAGVSGLILDDDDATPTRLVSPYAANELALLKYTQTGDVMYITHPSYKPRRLIRTDDNSWTISAPEFIRGPFLRENDTTTSMKIRGYTIDAVGTGAGGTFRIDDDGDLTPYFAVASVFTVHGSTSNDNIDFTVASVSYNSGTDKFTITVDGGDTVRTTADGVIWPDLSRGNNAVIVASAASGPESFVGFESTHVGALFQLTLLKESVAVNVKFSSQTTSDTVAVSLGQKVDFFTLGTWTGTIVLEASYDGGTTYEAVYPPSFSDDGNIELHHLNDVDDALYRLNMKAYTSGTAACNLVTRQHVINGVVEITGVTSTTVADCIMRSVMARADTPTKRWAEGAWSDKRGWPVAVTFFEQRLIFGGNTWQPITIWASKSLPGGDYHNFEAGANDDDAFTFTLAEAAQDPIKWLSTDKRLIIGTSGSEISLGATGSVEAVTPTNVGRVEQQSARGSASVAPIRTSLGHLFVERGGRKVDELIYRWDVDRFVVTDMTRLSDHITAGGITEIALQKRPETILWGVTGDGNLVGLTYLREENVVCWHRHVFGGDGLVESVAVIPGVEEDEVWCVVVLVIASGTKRYIVRLGEWNWGDDQEDAFFVDFGLTYDSTLVTPPSAITGLGHLEGESVAVLADGGNHNSKTVLNGQIILDRPASVVQVGLQYTSRLKPMKIPKGALGTGQTKIIKEAAINFYKTGYAEVGPNIDDAELNPIIFREFDDAMDTAVPLFTGTINHKFTGGYEKNGDIIIQSSTALPLTILSINLLTEVSL